MKSSFAFAAGLAAIASVMGCGSTPQGEEVVGESHQTFEEFMTSSVTYDAEQGIYLVERDIAFSSLERVKTYHSRQAQSGALTLNVIAGRDDAWSSTQKLALTYCVSRSSFGANHAEVVEAMHQAADAWEKVANIDFVHLSGEDDRCTADNAAVLFDVRQMASPDWAARAFFPHEERRVRNVLIDMADFRRSSSRPYTLVGVLRHELGHVLGFRHEHMRRGGDCSEPGSVRELTPYDAQSVMHYPARILPACGGTNTGDLVLTERDKHGASSVYGGVNRRSFNPDRHTDVLWRNEATGAVNAWFMDGTTVAGQADLTARQEDLRWQVRGTGDFNRDGDTDVLWHNTETGEVGIWFLSGTAVMIGGTVSQRLPPGSPWSIKGTGDFNNDGYTDILLHNAADNRVRFWQMNTSTFVYSTQDVDTRVAPDWELKGTGDFDRDGKLDLLWYHPASGKLHVWFLDHYRYLRGEDVNWSVPASTGWDLRGTGDYNLDGKVDLLWHHPGTGQVHVWFMHGTHGWSSTDMSWNVRDPAWKLVSR